MAFLGTSVCQAVSSAQAAHVRCDAPQKPQAPGVTTRPRCGSLSRKMISKPRNSSAEVHALVTTPLSMSTRTSRSPSTRPTGEMSSVWTAMVVLLRDRSDDEDVLLGPCGRGVLGCAGQRDVALLVDPGRQVLRDAHHGLRLEQRAGGEVEERELGLGATEARHAGARLRRLPVPEDAVARRVR